MQFEFNQLKKKEQDLNHQNETLVKNMALNYNFDPEFEFSSTSHSPSVTPKKSKSIVFSPKKLTNLTNLTKRKGKRFTWYVKDAILES